MHAATRSANRRLDFARRRRRLRETPSAALVTALGCAMALACVAAGAPAQSTTLSRRVDALLERARPALERHLTSSNDGQLALVCLAAVHDGLDPRSRPLSRALDRLIASRSLRTYGLALRIMVMGHLGDDPRRDRVIAADCERLLTHQSDNGYFTYGPHGGAGDLSNTQYAVLGLRVAARFGATVPREVWERLLDAALRSQSRDGGFAYRQERPERTTSSMTVAGIAVLEVCRQVLQLDEDEQTDVQRAVDRGWRWMRRHSDDIGSTKAPHCTYFHYGLERAAILSERDRIGRTDWYERGAKMLESVEAEDGGFSVSQQRRGRRHGAQHGTNLDTAFGVLFLRRRFQRTLQGPTTPGPSHLCHTLPPQATEEQIRTAIRIDTGRGLDAVPDLLEAMRSPHHARRKAAALALLRISGRDFRYHPSRDAAANAAALRRAERWWLDAKRDKKR